MIDYDRLHRQTAAHPYPLVFVTVGGPHLHGFASADSDFALRGAHQLPLELAAGLSREGETVEQTGFYGGLRVSLVTYDVKKFGECLLQDDASVLEDVFSPLVVLATPGYDELKCIASDCITRHHARHYLNRAAIQWKSIHRDRTPRIGAVLSVFRLLLTGIHLMRTGVVEANLPRLNEAARLAFIEELVQQKLVGSEQTALSGGIASCNEREFVRLTALLESSSQQSTLPEQPRGSAALNELLVRLRLPRRPV